MAHHQTEVEVLFQRVIEMEPLRAPAGPATEEHCGLAQPFADRQQARLSKIRRAAA